MKIIKRIIKDNLDYSEKLDQGDDWIKSYEDDSVRTYVNGRRIDFEKITPDDYLSGTNVAKSGDEWYRVIASHFDKKYVFGIVSKYEKVKVRKVKESKMNLTNLIT